MNQEMTARMVLRSLCEICIGWQAMYITVLVWVVVIYVVLALALIAYILMMFVLKVL